MFGLHSLPLAHKIVIHFWVPCLLLHNCYLLRHPGLIQQCSGHPELSGWMASLACLTGNRCVSSEDEGPADKHYWKTSAACHNTGQAGASPSHRHHPSATPESLCGRGEGEFILYWQSWSPITHPMLDVEYMFCPGTCLSQPDQSLFGQWGEKRLQCTWEMNTHTHTPYTTGVTNWSASPNFRLLSVRESGMALMLDL